jgi:DNA-directed RNA polymerase specialized sigma24 family protein
MRREMNRFAAAQAGDEVVVELLPLIRQRVVRALTRWSGRAQGRQLKQDVDDVCHEVLVALLADWNRILARWDPRRGLSFEAYIGFIVERQVLSLMRVARRNPWTEDPTATEDLELTDGDATLRRLEAHHLLERLVERLASALSPLGLRLFELLFFARLDIAGVCAESGLTRDAVYAWRSRLRKVARALHGGLSAAPSAPME